MGTDNQKTVYLNFLNSDLESERFHSGATLHALTLMSNHTHEVFAIANPVLFSNHMRRHHSRYGAFFNKQSRRCGKVAQDRPRTCLIGDDHHEMITTFYVHANPVRAGIVRDARDYAWSTHRLYAFGKRANWMRNIVLPNWYLRLGKTMPERQRNYRRAYAAYLRDSGGRRERFLQKYFFGPVSWTLRMEKEIASWRASRALSPNTS